MSHWLLDNIKEAREKALKQASSFQIYRELSNMSPQIDESFIRRTSETLELAVLDLISEPFADDNSKLKILKETAADAFRLFRVLPRRGTPIENAMIMLRMSSLAILGDMGVDAAKLLKETQWGDLPLESDNWGDRTMATILDVWLRLTRKDGWSDRDMVLEHIAKLRDSQKDFENIYLNSQEPLQAKAIALELICLYHLAKIAEIFAHFITDGVVEGNYQVKQLLETHFDRIFSVCRQTRMLEIEPLARLLSACSMQMIENSIWTVTRAVNSRVSQFVRCLVDKGRGNKALFDVLPPQRRTLAEKGLLGSSRRAVVVSLPTSSGKTLIAQFRILQALNQFEHERGWVAYLAPTKALVNQISRQIRRDFSALTPKILVEQVSPALEIDNIEMGLLQPGDPGSEFRVLVTTPEKLDLMLRQGWESKIGRPLTLVVVDEAHNIQSESRGLKLELLLATINKECRWAQFLLLTPFISNAREIARWLGGTNSDDISLSIDWQPNERIIGIAQAEKGGILKGKTFDYQLSLETIHTTKKTLIVDNILTLPKCEDIAKTFRNITDQSALAAVIAQGLQKRGPVIVMHQRPDWVWSLAEKFKITENRNNTSSEKIKLVQKFLALEFGDVFPLIDLLTYGVGVHHAGLSDEVRSLMEWLFEENELRFLVATTTISQGVNFPVSGVVMASHQYPYGEDMPPEDFWNIAGRAGRIGQGNLGVVVLVADDSNKAQKLREFIEAQTGELNSALIRMTAEAQNLLSDLEGIVYKNPEWSSFLQYLAHSYRQMGKPENFIDQIEQVLRGTLGFEKLHNQNFSMANRLIEGIHDYLQYLQRPGQPLKLVDSTGFSLQSINTVLTNKGDIDGSSWNSQTLFSDNSQTLRKMMGVLLKVPELRENLKAVTGGNSTDGQKLALIIKDWVNGIPVPEIAVRYFKKEDDGIMTAMTKCGQNLFGKLTQTASWGLGALLSITGSELPEEEFKTLSNLPSQVYYGVNNDAAIVLRLLGVSREAATPLAREMGDISNQPVMNIRENMKHMDDSVWIKALGKNKGSIYRKVWKILEGVE